MHQHTMGLEHIHLEDQGVKDTGVRIQMKRLDREREQRGNFGMDQFEEPPSRRETTASLSRL